MKPVKKFRPLSKIYLVCVVLLNLLLCGSIAALVIGVVGVYKFNWFELAIGIFGCLFLVIEDIKIFFRYIAFYDEYFIARLGILENSSLTYQKRKINYSEIEQIVFEEPYPLLKVIDKNKTWLCIYLKQFSKKQIQEILAIFNKTIRH